jgi:glutamate-5-semialdehyde dehydrogenase
MAEDISSLGKRAKEASRLLAKAHAAQKDAWLRRAAALLLERQDDLLAANAADVKEAQGAGATATQIDRLTLDPKRIGSMSQGLLALEALRDPVGEVVDGWVLPSGLAVERVRVPLGVIGIIYENRPNVTADAAGLCVKSGNAVMLRGSSSALSSNLAIGGVLREALEKEGLPADAICIVEDVSREAAVSFMRLEGIIDCLIPRGGPELVASVRENARVPYVIDGDGNCHVYVDRGADVKMAEEIVVNAKMQRPGVCNAAETLLVHKDVAQEVLTALAGRLVGVELVGDEETRRIMSGLVEVGQATEEDYAKEFLSLKLAIAVVDSIDEAISHIARYGTGHSEAIVTNDLTAAERFVSEVDAAAVLVNASTRLIDGYELGLGAEIGISTQKLHARGPMGLRELTCAKFVVHGQGHLRG